MISSDITFDLYSDNCFDRIAVPFQFCDRFSFLQIMGLSFSFYFDKNVLCVFVVCVDVFLFPLINQ